MQSLIISQQNVSSYAFSNIEAVQLPISSIVISLHGWYETNMRTSLTDFEIELAENHILSIYPYYSEWSWMNFPTIHLIDEITDFFFEQYKLAPDTPVAVLGKSMGGLSALIYTLYSKRTPIACAANCPICDLPFHVTEREDLPRTMYSAFGHYNIPLEIAMELHSPMHQIERMPHIPYYIVHGGADKTVLKEFHSDPYVKRMKQFNHVIEYHEIEGMKHCDFRPYPEEELLYHNFILSHVLQHSPQPGASSPAGEHN